MSYLPVYCNNCEKKVEHDDHGYFENPDGSISSHCEKCCAELKKAKLED